MDAVQGCANRHAQQFKPERWRQLPMHDHEQRDEAYHAVLVRLRVQIAMPRRCGLDLWEVGHMPCIVWDRRERRLSVYPHRRLVVHTDAHGLALWRPSPPYDRRRPT